MRRTILLGLALASMSSRSGVYTLERNEGQETLGPDISPYAKRPKKGKGERKANRGNRWG